MPRSTDWISLAAGLFLGAAITLWVSDAPAAVACDPYPPVCIV